ncbi:MAG: hypothetical protein ACSHX0_12910 [Akkermansiaceae bacterium]
MSHVSLTTSSPLLFAIALLIQLPIASADLLALTNFSFETPNTPNGTFSGSQSTGPSGWTAYNTGPTNADRFFGVWDPTGTTSYEQPLPEGQQVGVVFLDDALGLEAGLEQTLVTQVQPNTRYTLSVAVGNFAPQSGELWDFTGFPGYRVELLAGGNVLAIDNNTLSPAEGQFLLSTIVYDTGSTVAAEALGIRLVNLNGVGVEVNFDNVTLDASPLPPAPQITVSTAENSDDILVVFTGILQESDNLLSWTTLEPQPASPATFPSDADFKFWRAVQP